MPHIAELLTADGDDFISRPVPHLTLTLTGIEGDRHAGPLRRADARTPWHTRGTRIANTRQVSVVSVEECEAIAHLLDAPAIDPRLLGALVLAGVPGLSLLMPGTRLQLPSGATVFITEQNAPCRQPAARIAAALGRPQLVAGFARAAIGRRGVVGIVEREGAVNVGDAVRLLRSPAFVAAPALALPKAEPGRSAKGG